MKEMLGMRPIDHLGPADVAELEARIEAEVSSNWTSKVSPAEMRKFLNWALLTQVYFYPGNEEKLGDAFRGFVVGSGKHER